MTDHEFKGHEFTFVETPQLPSLVRELFDDNYEVFKSGIEIRPGDVILDLGANEGIFSVMMGKMFPGAFVIAYEPVLRTFDVLLTNIQANNAYNVSAYQFGIGGVATTTEMVVSKDFSGGSSNWCTFKEGDHTWEMVHMVTLDSIFDLHDIDRCRLLKMDIEGGEYEALYATKMLPLVDYMVAEFHMNHKLEFRGRRTDALTTWVQGQTKLIHMDACRMAE